MDTVNFGEIFAFTAVDIYSRETDIVLGPSLTSHDSAIFLDTCMRKRFNRTVRKECLGWAKYKRKQLSELTDVVNVFLDRYHYNRPHIGLGMKPPLKRG